LTQVLDWRFLSVRSLTEVKVAIVIRDDRFLGIETVDIQLDFRFTALGGLVFFAKVYWSQSRQIKGLGDTEPWKEE